MCGIAGFYSFSGNKRDHQLEAMNQAMIHRGPDGEGIFRSARVSLSMRRLSIIDLDGGTQPLFNEDRSVAVVCNGEIYNHVELRQALEAEGHHFRTKSDSETIVHAYESYGLDLVHHLRGMFAFALWDERRNRLILGRDRMGEKPLYYHYNGKQLVFASEIKSLLKSGHVRFELDIAQIHQYLHYGYVPEPYSLLKGVNKLPAGHLLLTDAEGAPHVIAYWSMDNIAPLEGDPTEIIRSALHDLTEVVLRSDVPVGIALSGGVDSSTIAVLSSHHKKDNYCAFSIGYPGRPEYDERDQAAALARMLGMPFFDVELTTEDLTRNFPDLIASMDEPVADPAAFAYLALTALARRHNVPVLLQGHGGDELFWGYPWVKEACQMALNSAPITGHHPFYELTPGFRDALRMATQFYSDETRAVVAENPEADPFKHFTFDEAPEYLETAYTKLICNTYLIGNGLALDDKLSMANSVESRLPLLDYKLVEAIIGLRKTYGDVSLQPKAWLKAAVSGLVPEEILSRKKRGFQPPVKDWLIALNTAYGHFIKDGYLVSEGILNGKAAETLSSLPFYKQPDIGMSYIPYHILILELWCRIMLNDYAPVNIAA